MSNPRVSILLVTYNRPQFIGGAIESVKKQTFTDWELVIVDDSENDAVENVMKNYTNDTRIKYFHRVKKGTIANASNFGLQEARGEYVAILDDDDWWIDHEKLKKQVAFLDAHPDHVGCGGGFEIINEEGKKIGTVLKPEHDEVIRRVALYANPMANATTMFRRDAAKAIGNYNESLKQFADLDFWLSMGKKGKLYNFPEIFLGYRMWRSGSSFSHQRENATAGLQIIKKHRGEYPGYLTALTLAWIHVIYARLPKVIRQVTNSFMSRLKKALFSK